MNSPFTFSIFACITLFFTPTLATAKIRLLASGDLHTCIVNDSNQVKCWGVNSEGQLGIGNVIDHGGQGGTMGKNLSDALLTDTMEIKKLHAGENFTCAHYADDQVKCWGSNQRGRILQGTRNNLGTKPEELGKNLPALNLGSQNGKPLKVKEFYQGFEHACAWLENNQIKCFGRNDIGSLGVGSSSDIGDQAAEVGDKLAAIDFGTATVKQFFAKGYHSCALLTDDTLHCWGYNGYGTLGMGTSSSTYGSYPTQLPSTVPAIKLGTLNGKELLPSRVFTGTFHICALFNIANAEKLKCWGINENGQLGYGDTRNRGQSSIDMGDNLPFVDLGTDLKITDITMGIEYTCVLFEGGKAKCFGGGVGDAPDEMGKNLPFINLGTKVTIEKMSAGNNFVCALTLPLHQVKCWGKNSVGQLGLEDKIDRNLTADDGGDELPYVDVGL